MWNIKNIKNKLENISKKNKIKIFYIMKIIIKNIINKNINIPILQSIYFINKKKIINIIKYKLKIDILKHKN